MFKEPSLTSPVEKKTEEVSERVGDTFEAEDSALIVRAEDIFAGVKGEIKTLALEMNRLEPLAAAGTARGMEPLRVAAREAREAFNNVAMPAYFEIMDTIKPVMEKTGKIPNVANETFLSLDFLKGYNNAAVKELLAKLTGERSKFSLIVERKVIENGGLRSFAERGMYHDEKNPLADKMQGNGGPYAKELRKTLMKTAQTLEDPERLFGRNGYWQDYAKAHYLYLAERTLRGVDTLSANDERQAILAAKKELKERQDAWILENPEEFIHGEPERVVV